MHIHSTVPGWRSEGKFVESGLSLHTDEGSGELGSGHQVCRQSVPAETPHWPLIIPFVDE